MTPAFSSEFEAHVWQGRVDEIAETCRGGSRLLSAEERARLDRFRFEADRQRFLCARVMVRRLLAGYLEVDPETLSLAVGVHGKPYLSAHPHLRFSLSHAGDRILVAVSRGAEIGVDVERSDRGVETDALAQRVCHANERTYLTACEDETARVALFFRYWCHKEAYFKALGVGLAGGLASVEVQFQGDAGCGRITDHKGAERHPPCCLVECDVGPAYTAAVAVMREDARISLRRFAAA